MLSDREKIAIIEVKVLEEVLLLRQQIGMSAEKCAIVSTNITLEFVKELGLYQALEANESISNDVMNFLREFNAISEVIFKDHKFPYKGNMDEDK